MNKDSVKKFQGSFYICGFMGSGKTAMGKLLATELQLEFKDLDDYLVEQEGKSIPEIFEASGEAYFRQKEWDYLLKLTQNFKGVVALGGGALHNQQVVDHLKVNGLLILIDTPLDVIVDRVRRKTTRPIVIDTDGEIKSRESLLEELKMLYSKRFKYYAQAEIKLIASGFESKEQQLGLLMEKIKKYV